jgi:hypothetical protein
MKRRQALLVLAGTALIAGLAARIPEESGVAAILFKRLKYLELDPDGVREFARDYISRRLMSAGKLRVVAAAGPLYARLSPAWGDLLSPDIEHGEDRIVTTFLLSSDFFAEGADAGRKVTYVGFFDPLRGGNPFASARCRAIQTSRLVHAAPCEAPC